VSIKRNLWIDRGTTPCIFQAVAIKYHYIVMFYNYGFFGLIGFLLYTIMNRCPPFAGQLEWIDIPDISGIPVFV
jgi:hypothetical protein